MWRYIAGGVAAVLLAVAGVMLMRMPARSGPVLPPAPPAQAGGEAALPDTVPEASARTREEKRFDRYDKDRNALVTREEYLASRRKAFARLDSDGNGTLSFDEWAAKTREKFATADADTSATLTRAEFATTAVKRRAPARRPCPPAGPAEES